MVGKTWVDGHKPHYRIAGSTSVHGGTEGVPHNAHHGPHGDGHHDGHLVDTYRDHARNTVSK